tara:strand:+ start:22 stop:978 length:957 start_codon:yes stop_codon:yes gene_type:complete
MSETNFIDPNKKTKYGQHGVQIWIGTVVGYASQEEQIESGWGWRYKVRIDGDHALGSDQIKDKDLDYATVLLPTTAGSGAAFKLRSVRISQGDQVYGLRGGGEGAPTMILGVLPRTRFTKNSSGNFGVLSGFYGSLKKNKTLSGEFNDQIGPATPGVTPLSPKTYNKSNRENPSGNLEQLGYDQNQDGVIDDVEEKLNPPTVAGDRKWDEGEPINSAQVEYILSNQIQVEIMEDDKDKPLISNDQIVGYEQVGTGTFETVNLMETEESSAYTRKVLDQAVTQNLVTKEIADKALVDLTNGNPEVALERIFPPPPPTSD